MVLKLKLLTFAGSESGSRKLQNFLLLPHFFLSAEEVDSGSAINSGTLLSLPGPCTAGARLNLKLPWEFPGSLVVRTPHSHS